MAFTRISAFYVFTMDLKKKYAVKNSERYFCYVNVFHKVSC